MKNNTMLLAAAAAALTLTGCSSLGADAAPEASPADIEHVHAITGDPGSTDVLLATHNGIYSVSESGELAGPLGGHRFDSMGFAVLDGEFVASGHPGTDTPAELGNPNLGIIASGDRGSEWQPVALTGTEDFHVLTAGANGKLYGVGSSRPNVVTSGDGGRTWDAGAALAVADLAWLDGVLYAVTETGLLRSTDDGASFSAVVDAPALMSLETLSDDALVGLGTDGSVLRGSPAEGWDLIGQVTGAPQALGAANGSAILLDDRGLVEIGDAGERVLL